MKICICHNVSDKEIIRAIKTGITDTVTLMELLKVGTCCRQCVPDLHQLIAKHSIQHKTVKPTLAPVVFIPSQA